MIDEDMMFSAACAAFGNCIGSKYCAELVAGMLMRDFDVSIDKASEVAAAAYKEWIEAYE